jgi:hypothetical protein
MTIRGGGHPKQAMVLTPVEPPENQAPQNGKAAAPQLAYGGSA